MAGDYCPGGGDIAAPGTQRGRNRWYPGLGECRCCHREFKLRYDGRIFPHKTREAH